MGYTLDWCKNAEPNLNCVQKTSAKKVKEHQDSIPKGGRHPKQEGNKDNQHFGPWGTAAGGAISSSSTDAFPSALEPNSSDKVSASRSEAWPGSPN